MQELYQNITVSKVSKNWLAKAVKHSILIKKEFTKEWLIPFYNSLK